MAVQEMVDGVRDDGIEFSFNLKKTLSFSALVKRLEQLGIIRAINPGINPNPLLAAPPGPHAHPAVLAAGNGGAQHAGQGEVPPVPLVQPAPQAAEPGDALPAGQALEAGHALEAAQAALNISYRAEVLTNLI